MTSTKFNIVTLGCWFLGFLLLLTHSSCQSGLNPEEYQAYLQDTQNGCHTIHQAASIQVDMLYWPPEAEAIRLRKPNNVLSSKRMRYFQVQFTPLNTKLLLNHPHYWTFGIQHDFWLETPQGKLPCIFFHAEKGVHTPQGYICLVGFEVNETFEESGTLFLVSADLGIGPLRFTPDCHPPTLQLSTENS